MSEIPLLRNKSGTARDRDPSAPVEDLEFEAAIGRNVRQLRQQHGLTVAEMAARVGISKAMMSKIENAQTSCSLSTLALLARGLDVPVTSLFRGADVERPAAFVKAGTGAENVAVCPRSSVTLSTTLKVPTAANVFVVVGPALDELPSPKFQL